MDDSITFILALLVARSMGKKGRIAAQEGKGRDSYDSSPGTFAHFIWLAEYDLEDAHLRALAESRVAKGQIIGQPELAKEH